MVAKQSTEIKELKQFIGDRFDELKTDIALLTAVFNWIDYAFD